MIRPVTLSAFSAGMTRLRTKGGASPETLYEVTNAYVTISRTLKQRPAVRAVATFPGGTKGLCSFKGTLYTFTAGTSTPTWSGNVTRELRHPDPTFAGTIKRIWYAQPFMGLLYVVAEFSDNNVYHYWLQDPAAWAAFTVYQANQLVQPTTPNGFYYAASLQNPPPAWQPLHQYSTGNVIEPTKYNGFSYTATNLLPSSPTSSSDTEPTWPTDENSFVLESSAGGSSTQPTPPTIPPAPAPGTGTDGRYANIGGGLIRNRFLTP